MKHALLLLLVGCANLPEIGPCDPTGLVLAPTYLNMGNDDFMIASLSYTGCPEYDFGLCGIGNPWITRDTVTLGIWYDPDELLACNEEVLVDELLSVRPIRERYEDEFDVDTADIVLDVSGVLVDYSFAPAPR